MYTIKERDVIWLDSFEFLSYNKKKDILTLYRHEENIRELWGSKKMQLSTFLSVDEYEKIANSEPDRIEKLLNWYESKNIAVLTIFSSDYPTLLHEIDTPPLCLYCKGNIQLLNTVCCGVVGTRKPTDYGRVVTKQFVEELASFGVTIVSGMAMGVDTIAHETALKKETGTIAVLAGGFDHIFPACNHTLFKNLAESNLVISESLPNVVPSAYLFPVRNRIIAGLSKAVLITEAGTKSGSLHTKNYAVNYNREVFAVPGKITSPESTGTNAIIKECQASLCLSAQDILDFLRIKQKKINKNPTIQLDITEQSILNYILADKKTYQEILDYIKISPSELNNILFEMQMNGLIEKLAGNSYVALIRI